MSNKEKILHQEIAKLKEKVERLEANKKYQAPVFDFVAASKDVYGYFDETLKLTIINKAGVALFKKINGKTPVKKNVKELFKNFSSGTDKIEKYIRSGNHNIPIEISHKKQFYTLHAIKIGENIGIKIIDTTKQKELQEKELRLSEIVNTIHELFYNVKINADGTKEFAYLSPQIKKVLGFSPQEYDSTARKGKLIEYIHPDDIPGIVKASRELNKYKKPQKYIYRFMHNIKKQYVWIEEQVFPEFDAYGNQIANYGLSRDVTQQIIAEKALKASEEKYRNLFERNQAGVFRTEFETGKMIECNDSFARIFGYKKKEQMMGESSKTLYFDEKDREDYKKELLKKSKLDDYKLRLKKRDGSELWAIINVAVIKDKDQPVIIQGTLTNITDLIRVEQLLKKSEKDYKSLINNSPMGIIIIDNKEKLLFANERAMKVFKVNSLEKFNQNDIFKAIPQNEIYHKRYLDRKKLVNSRGESPFLEFDIMNNKGEKIIIESKVNRISYQNKEAYQITFQDITYKKQIEKDKLKLKIAEETNKVLQEEIQERKQVEKQLLEAKNYTESIISSSIDMILTSDESDTIIEFNNAALENFGYKSEEIIGKKIDALYKYPEERKKVHHALKSKGVFTGEITNIRKDGSTFVSYISASYIYDSTSKIIGSMGISRDITQTKKDREKIKEQAAKLKSIIENSSHLFWTYSQKTGVTSFNQNYANAMKDLYGLAPQINKHYDEVNKKFDPEKIEKIEKIEKFWHNKYNKAFQGKKLQFETTRHNQKGKQIFREIFLNPIYGEDNTITEISGIAHDITKQKLAEQKLIKSLKEKEVLLQEVHHRVKNNLQIISSIFNLQASYIKDEKILQILAESQNRIKSMAFIHEILYQNKDFSNINFSQYIENLSNNLLHSYAVKGNIKIQLDLQYVLLNLDMAIPCGLIINELVTNAIKYAFPSGKKGIISISLHKKANQIQLTIKDNGKGIPENIDFMNTASLGLQLVVTLVEQINGQISLNADEGTTFAIKFKT